MEKIMDYEPYCYLIGWSKYDKWYYGSESGYKSKIANPSNLWLTYFTSSKHIKQFRKEYGEPDVIEVRKTFKTKDECILWEEKVLCKLEVIQNEKWLNKSTTKVHDRTGTTHPEKTKKKMSESHKGQIPWNKGRHNYLSEESISKMRESRMTFLSDPENFEEWKNTLTPSQNQKESARRQCLKMNRDPEKIRKTAEKNKGSKRTELQRNNISKACEGKVYNKIECHVCGRTIGANNFDRHSKKHIEEGGMLWR